MNASIKQTLKFRGGCYGTKQRQFYIDLGNLWQSWKQKEYLTLLYFFSTLQPLGINFNDKKLKQSCLNSLYTISIFIRSFGKVMYSEHLIKCGHSLCTAHSEGSFYRVCATACHSPQLKPLQVWAALPNAPELIPGMAPARASASWSCPFLLVKSRRTKMSLQEVIRNSLCSVQR